MMLKASYEAAGEQACLAVSFQCAFVPAILALFCHINYVTNAQLKFSFVLRRIRYSNSIPEKQE